jgi:hypothetical protein
VTALCKVGEGRCHFLFEAAVPGLCPGLRARTLSRLTSCNCPTFGTPKGDRPRKLTKRMQPAKWVRWGMCIYIYICIYIYVYKYVYVSIYVYVHIYIYVFGHISYIYIYVCICIHVDMCMLIYLCGCLDQWTGVSVVNQPVSYLLLDAMAEAWGHCCCEGACEIQSGRLKIHIRVAELVEGKIHRNLPDLIL